MLFSSDVVAPDCPDTVAALTSKHPLPAASLRMPEPPEPDAPHLIANKKDVLAAVMSFQNGSAGGLDGLSPQHLKDLLCGATGDAGERLLDGITQLINLMLSGKVCSEVLGILYGANLCALKKKDGGIRPIAVGFTFRRICSKICCKHIFPSLTKKFQPFQLGFGSKGGCEAAVHAARAFVNDDSCEVLLKVDVKNAFNSVDRGALLTQIQDATPLIYKYLWQCYHQSTNLLFKTHHLASAVGCQQGDPLGPAIFSLAIHPIISNLNSKFNSWYLDDGTLGGDWRSVLDDLRSLTDSFNTIGLELNFTKCELFINNPLPTTDLQSIISNFNTLAPNIKIIDKTSLRLLGAPIFPESIEPIISEHLITHKAYSDRLLKISAHMALVIIKFCLFVPKFTYILRCSPVWKYPHLIEPLDSVLKLTLSSILNINLDNRAWTQASLPIRHGGLGIRQVVSVALPAFLSSFHSTQDLANKIFCPPADNICIQIQIEAKNSWTQACPENPIPAFVHSQKLWDEPLCRVTLKALIDNAQSPAERARLLAVSEPESGLWLHALPSPNIGTLLERTTLALATSLRLGVKTNEPHRCRCGSIVDELGHHGLSCQRSAGRISRHASLNDVIRRALASVSVPAILEPNGIARDDGKRPDGMTLIPWRLGRTLVWDATCVDTLAPSHLQATSVKAGAAATTAEQNKRRKYAVLGEGYIFAPFGVETLGPWGPSAKRLFKEISQRLIDTSGDRRAGSYLGQRISLAIQKGKFEGSPVLILIKHC
ncbi:uncharacterized protein LOC134791601 [Cydia splendana]|uniref:uncharacterized protein LOC134791601 n=1 Tax=Cydia splendana TaxID=1100963 RepID=UPI00300D5B35